MTSLPQRSPRNRLLAPAGSWWHQRRRGARARRSSGNGKPPRMISALASSWSRSWRELVGPKRWPRYRCTVHGGQVSRSSTSNQPRASTTCRYRSTAAIRLRASSDTGTTTRTSLVSIMTSLHPRDQRGEVARDDHHAVDNSPRVARHSCELLCRRLAHPCQRRAVDVIGPQHHRDALVGARDPVILIPVRTAPPGGGTEDMAAGQAQRLGVGIAGVGELRLALEHQEPRPPINVRHQHRAAGIPQEVLELRPGLRDGYAHPTVPRIHGDDAELRHAVPPERGEDALRIVVEELFDLRG